MSEYEHPEASLSPISLPWYKTWFKALIPEDQAYETIAADPGASAGKACLWVFLTNMISGGVMMLVAAAFAGLVFMSMVEELDETMLTEAGAGIVALACFLPVVFGAMGVVGLLLMSSLSHAMASMLGGTGTFSRLTYAFGAYLAPLSIVSLVISFIPIVNYLGFVVGIYGIVLNIMAVKAVHQLDWGRAVASSVIIWIALLGCSAIVVIVILTLMGPSIGTVFSGVLNDLMTVTPMP